MKLFNIKDYEVGMNACTKDGQTVEIIDPNYNGCFLYYVRLDPKKYNGRTKQAIVWDPNDEFSDEVLYTKPKIMYTPVYQFKNVVRLQSSYLFDTEDEAINYAANHENFIGIAKVELL